MNMKLNWRMTGRRKLHTALIVLFLATTTVFLQLYPRIISDVEQELDRTYKNTEVTGWLLNGESYEKPQIPFETRDALLATGQIKQIYAYTYAYMTAPDAYIWKRMEANHPEENDEQLCTRYLKWKLDEGISTPPTLYGINCADASQSFARLAGNVHWAEGYTMDCLSGGEPVCILPIYTGFAPGDTAPVVVHKYLHDSANEKLVESKVYLLTVAGVYENHDSTGAIGGYCPIETMKDLLPVTWKVSIRSLSFIIADNHKLAEFKQQLYDMGLGEGSVRAAIDDRILNGTVAPLESNLRLLRGLKKLFYAAVAAIAFFLCFLLARGRKPEYAVMRLLGESTAKITFKALVEQLFLCLMGIGLGMLMLGVIGQGSLNIATCGIIMACYTLGAAMAVLLTVRVNVMEILRDKE